jgi:hypothetical protein
VAKVEDMIRQMQAVLPQFTTKFNESVTIIGVVDIGSGVFEIETSAVHGLEAGNYINIRGVLAVNSITSITYDSDSEIVVADTTVDHDLSTGFQDVVNISGFGAITDGEFTFVSAITASQFSFSSAIEPTGLGQINEDRIDGINGRYEVDSITSTTKFRITSETVFTSFKFESTSVMVSEIRVSGASTVDRLIKYYSENTINDYWAIVIPDATVVSFSRRINSDAKQKFQRSDEIQYECIQTYSIYVLAPATDTISGRFLVDEMVDIRAALCKALVGVKFDSGFSDSDKYIMTFNGDDFFDYVGAYYVHKFDFETVFNFSPEDAVGLADNKAFREFNINIKMEFDSFDLVKKTIAGKLP